MGKNIALNGLESRVVPLIWNWYVKLTFFSHSSPPVISILKRSFLSSAFFEMAENSLVHLATALPSSHRVLSS